MSGARSNSADKYRLWSDAETEVDLLGFTHLVDAVEHLVRSDHLLPATIGVFGDWGSGKTSVLKMASSRLQKDEKILTLWFNGWLFEGYDQTKSSLMERLVSELLAKRRTSNQVKQLAIRLFRRINWLRVAGTTLKVGGAFALGGPPMAAVAAAPDLAELAKKVGESLETVDEDLLENNLKECQAETFSRNIEGFREDFQALLKEANIERLVVIIDDLDRCLPPTVIQTLEAIKLFLSVGNVAFVIGADERLVQYAVRQRFPELPGDRADVGRDYLEKLIQYPIRIPSLSRSEVQSYVALLFVVANGDKELTSHAIEWFNSPDRSISGDPFGHNAFTEYSTELPQSLTDGLTLSSQIGPLLGQGLNGNPRQCKRYLNMLMMRLGMAESRGVELSRKLLAKLMILEYLKPELFRQLGDMQAEGHGRPESIIKLQNRLIKSGNEDEANTEKDHPNHDDSLNIWSKDAVAVAWLKIDPFLDDTDLGPYYYFSRDVLTDHGQQGQRLSPVARTIFRKLISASKAIRNTGLDALDKLSLAEASALQAEVCNRARSEENSGSDGSACMLLFDMAQKRADQVAGVLAFLQTRPNDQLPIWVVPRTLQITQNSDLAPIATELITAWSESSNKLLANAAKQVIKRKPGRSS